VTPEFSEALAKDATIREMVKTEARYLFEEDYNANDYKWIIGKNKGLKKEYQRWVTAINQEDDFDETAKKVLTWLPSIKNDQTQGFRVMSNSGKKKVCGRGLLSLSYRQAQNLGMNAQPDAIFKGKESNVSSDTKRVNQLLSKVSEYELDQSLLPGYYRELDEGEELPDAPETAWQGTRSTDTYCLYQTGIDDRESRGKVITMLKTQYGYTDMGQSNSISKVARIYAADLPEENYSSSKKQSAKLKFKDKIGSSLARSDINGQEWVSKQTSRVIARALVIPCIITLKGNDKIKEVFFGDNPSPSPVACFALSWRLTEDTN
jgi:hypothetical protein